GTGLIARSYDSTNPDKLVRLRTLGHQRLPYSVRRRPPAEHALLQRDQQIIGRHAEDADGDRPDEHVADAEPGARVVDEIAEAGVGGDELGGDDDQKPDRETEPEPKHDIRQHRREDHVAIDLKPPKPEALTGAQQHGIDVADADDDRSEDHEETAIGDEKDL